MEAALYRAWPPGESQDHNGWILRFGDGFSRRLNSVTVTHSGSAASPQQLAFVSSWLEERGISPVVRVHAGSSAGVDDSLEALGYREEGRTDVMGRRLQSAPADDGLVIRSRPSDDWLEAERVWFGVADDAVEGWRRVLSRVHQPCAFAELRDGGELVGAALAVPRGRWMSLFEVVADPARRREGIGRRLVDGLGSWGLDCGATEGLLQVVATNVPAVTFWTSLGFRRRYGYWYRRPSAR